MIYILLGLTFVVFLLFFFLVYVPIKSGVQKKTTQAKDKVTKQLEEMFIFISVDHLYIIKFLNAILTGFVVFVVTFNAKPPFPYIAGAVMGLVGFFGPEIMLFYSIKKRREKFAEQLVDGLILLANGLRAGFSLQQSIEMLIQEMPPPISQEFELTMREYRVGMELDQALTNIVERTKDPDLDLAVTAIHITKQVGGNLSEIFVRIVEMVRERKLHQGKAEALTAQGKMQATVVGLLPYVFAFFLAKINPELMSLMWTTWQGLACLVVVIILDTVGYFWVLKIANVEF